MHSRRSFNITSVRSWWSLIKQRFGSRRLDMCSVCNSGITCLRIFCSFSDRLSLRSDVAKDDDKKSSNEMDTHRIFNSTNDLESSEGSIVCEAPEILPPNQCFPFFLLKGGLSCRRLEFSSQEDLGVTTCYICKRVLSCQHFLRLIFGVIKELLEEYVKRSRLGHHVLEGHLPHKSCLNFQVRTASLGTKDWRWRHNQPLQSELLHQSGLISRLRWKGLTSSTIGRATLL